MTKFFKGKKKVPAAASPVPRELKEIQAQYNDLCLRAGQIAYQKYVLDKDAEQVNSTLLSVNHEAAVRQKLDKEAAEASATDEKVETT